MTNKPKLCFVGTSHAARHLAEAARDKGFPLVSAMQADLIFCSEDTPTDRDGVRDLEAIRSMVYSVAGLGKQIVLTSAVPPGFTRSLGIPDIIHQPELLRIKDAAERANNPEQIIMGFGTYPNGVDRDSAYWAYCRAWECPKVGMTWEDAEFAKMAINAHLIAQVEFTNAMSQLAKEAGANWDHVASVLKNDKRIGPHAYLTPGKWEASSHLMRDYVTLDQIGAHL